MSDVRVRFAPSPTGLLHIGGIRTALFNYLFAKQNNGQFIIRIEDTDQNRLVEGAEEYIYNALEWCGLIADESPVINGPHAPYKQSERSEIYKTYVDQILNSGYAYYAFDTEEELTAIRKAYEKEGKFFAYNTETRHQLNNSLSLSKEKVEELLASDTPYVIRFKIPENRTIKVNDIIRGHFSVESHTLDDKVLFKSDGLPTYHFANIIDDHLMQISHVIRGEEWLPSLPLHLLLYEAMQWKAPEFAHLPLILKPEGNGKLSKRDGDKHGFPVFPLQSIDKEGNKTMGFREQGYLSDAFVNLLALIGWSPPDEQEIMTMEELIKEFDLKKVHKAGARFNPEKAVSVNHKYIQNKTAEDLIDTYNDILKERLITPNPNRDITIINLLKERANFLQDIYKEAEFFYHAPQLYDEKAKNKFIKENSKDLLLGIIKSLHAISFEETQINDAIKAFVDGQNIGLGQLMPLLRLSLVGEMKGPDVPKIMEILGQEETIERIEKFINTI